MYALKHNPSARDLGELCPGTLVHVISEDERYLLKCEVIRSEQFSVFVKICAIFTLNGSKVLGKENALVGQERVIPRHEIHLPVRVNS